MGPDEYYSWNITCNISTVMLFHTNFTDVLSFIELDIIEFRKVRLVNDALQMAGKPHCLTLL